MHERQWRRRYPWNAGIHRPDLWPSNSLTLIRCGLEIMQQRVHQTPIRYVDELKQHFVSVGARCRIATHFNEMAVLCGMPTIQYSARSARYLWDSLNERVQRWQVVKVIWNKAHRRRRRMVQCYSTGDGEYDWICASFGLIDRLSRFCTAHGRKCL